MLLLEQQILLLYQLNSQDKWNFYYYYYYCHCYYYHILL